MRLVFNGMNGWWAKLSNDGTRVAAGSNEVNLIALAAPDPRQFAQTARTMGWWGSQVIIQAYEQNCSVLSVDPSTMAATVVALGQNLSRATAGTGHWGGGFAGGASVWDGATVENPSDWHVGCDGDWLVVLTEQEAHIYERGLIWKSIPTAQAIYARDFAIVREGKCGIGRNGPPQLIDLRTGVMQNVSVTPWRQECEPCYSQGWICTVDGKYENAAYVRPVGSMSVITLPVPEGAIGCDFRVVGTRGVVATWSSTGLLVVQDCDLTAPRYPVPAPPVPPDMQDPAGTLTVAPSAGAAPLTTTATLTLTQGATQQIRFYAKDDATGALVKWSGPTGNEAIAQGIIDKVGGWSAWARMQGKNGTVVDTPAVTVTVVTPQPIPPDPPPSTFTLGLNAGFGDPLPDDRLAGMVARGVKVVRTWIGKDAATAQAVVSQLAQYTQITPVYIIHCTTLAEMEQQLGWVPNGSMVECGNECNIGMDGPRLSPSQYVDFANRMRILAAPRDLTVYYGSVSNCSQDGLAWLSGVLALAPWINLVSVHRYSNQADCNPYTSTWGSRAIEFQRILGVLRQGRVEPRKVRVTEWGCKCGPKVYRTGWWIFARWHGISEQQQLDILTADLNQWRGSGLPVVGLDVYQENSGPTDDSPECWGLNNPQGAPRLGWGIYLA